MLKQGVFNRNMSEHKYNGLVEGLETQGVTHSSLNHSQTDKIDIKSRNELMTAHRQIDIGGNSICRN